MGDCLYCQAVGLVGVRISTGKDRPPAGQKEKLISGGIWAGITMVVRSPYLLGICLLMLLFTTLATFLYLMQAQIIRDAFVDSAAAYGCLCVN